MQDRSDIHNSSSIPFQYGRGLPNEIISLAVPFVFILGATAPKRAAETMKTDKDKESVTSKSKNKNKNKNKKQTGSGYGTASSAAAMYTPNEVVSIAYDMVNSI